MRVMSTTEQLPLAGVPSSGAIGRRKGGRRPAGAPKRTSHKTTVKLDDAHDALLEQLLADLRVSDPKTGVGEVLRLGLHELARSRGLNRTDEEGSTTV